MKHAYVMLNPETGTVITKPMSLPDAVSRMAEYFGNQTVADIVRYTPYRIARA